MAAGEGQFVAIGHLDVEALAGDGLLVDGGEKASGPRVLHGAGQFAASAAQAALQQHEDFLHQGTSFLGSCPFPTLPQV